MSVVKDMSVVDELKRRGLTTGSLAMFLGINRRIVQRWMNGHRVIPPRYLAAINRYFETGSFISGHDNNAYYATRHYDDFIRRDGVRHQVKGPKYISKS